MKKTITGKHHMTVYFYAPRVTETALRLMELLKAKRIPGFDGMRFTNKGQPIEFGKNDVVVCWGRTVPSTCAPRVINSSIKFSDNAQLNLQGVSKAQGGFFSLMVQRFPSYTKYLSAVKAFQELGPKQFVGGLMPSLMIDGYGTTGLIYVKEYKVHLVGNECVLAFERKTFKPWTVIPVTSIPNQALTMFIDCKTAMALDFVTVTTAVDSGGAWYMRKLNLAPELEAEHVEAYAAALNKLIG